MSDNDGVEKEQPKEGLKAVKKQKTSADTPKKDPAAPKTKETEEEKVARLEAQKLKKQQIKEKVAKKQEAKKAKKQSKAAELVNLGEDEDPDKIEIEVDGIEADVDDAPDANEKNAQPKPRRNQEANEEANEKINFDGLVEEAQPGIDSTATQSPDQSPLFDNNNEPSTSTSTTSTIPPTTAPKHIKVPR